MEMYFDLFLYACQAGQKQIACDMFLHVAHCVKYSPLVLDPLNTIFYRHFGFSLCESEGF